MARQLLGLSSPSTRLCQLLHAGDPREDCAWLSDGKVKTPSGARTSVELHLYGASHFAEARPTNFFGYLLTHGRPIG